MQCRAFVHGKVFGLLTLDQVLGLVGRSSNRVAFELDVRGDLLANDTRHATCFRIPAHSITYLEHRHRSQAVASLVPAWSRGWHAVWDARGRESPSARTMKRSTPTVGPTRHPLYTIGHSTRTYTELVETLRAWNVSTLVDIRRFTQSRTNPQFNESVLGPCLRKDGIAYLALPALGGRRSKSKVADPVRNAGWQNAAFKNYADYADTEPFVEGLARLMTLASRSTCAIMCSEVLWWRCHRRIVADHLLANGIPTFHIFTATAASPAALTPFARVDRKRKTVRYAAERAVRSPHPAPAKAR